LCLPLPPCNLEENIDQVFLPDGIYRLNLWRGGDIPGCLTEDDGRARIVLKVVELKTTRTLILQVLVAA